MPWARRAASRAGQVGLRLLVALHLGCSWRAAMATDLAAHAQGRPSLRALIPMFIIIVHSGREQPDPTQDPTGPSRTQFREVANAPSYTRGGTQSRQSQPKLKPSPTKLAECCVALGHNPLPSCLRSLACYLGPGDSKAPP